MLFPRHLLSLSLPLLLVGRANALDIDVTKPESLKTVAKTLAGSIIALYNKLQNDTNPGFGLFGDSGGPYFFHESGHTWNALISYAHLTGDKQHNDAISKALEWQVGDIYRAFMPPNQTRTLGNDDQSTWGLAALTAAETGLKNPQNFTWLDSAKAVFDIQAQRWDEESCGGGHKWQIFTFNQGYNYKNTASNGLFFLLAARLAHVTGNTNKTYIEWAEKSFQWANDIGLVRDFAVLDGTDDVTNCSQINQIQWSSNHGVYTEGAAILYNLTNGSEMWKNAVTGFVESGSVFRDNQTSVLVEVACERNGKCDIDQRTFKGIAARSMARAALYAPIVADDVRKTLEATAKAAAAGCSGEGEGLKCARRWTGGSADAQAITDGGLGEALNALEVTQSLLFPEAKLGGNSNNTASTSPSATGSGSAPPPPPSHTGAAPRTAAAWDGMMIAGMAALLVLV